jgi:hypothetical protein
MRRLHRVGRRAVRAVALAVPVALAVLGTGAALGRWQVLPGAGGGLVLVEPVAAATVDAGDTVVVAVPGREPGLRRVAAVVDSWAGRVALDRGDDVRLPPRVWRVTRSVPVGGALYGALVDRARGAVLVGAGVACLVAAVRPARRGSRRAAAAAAAVALVAGPVVASAPAAHGGFTAAAVADHATSTAPDFGP